MKRILTVVVWILATASYGVEFKPGTTVRFGGNWQASVVQVIDDQNMLVKLDIAISQNPETGRISYDTRTVWVNAPTTGLSDEDSGILPGETFDVVGTKQYQSALGTSTVPQLRLITAEMRREKAEKAKAAADARLIRDWVDSTGKHTLRAKFLDFEFNGSLVHLERTDDAKLVKIPVTRLSKEDQKWVRDEMKSRGGK